MSQPVRLFAFAGFTGKLMGLDAPRLADCLAPLGIEAHLLTDRARLLFLRGADPHGSEAEMLDDLRDRIAGAPAIFAGASGGGYAALRAAALLGVPQVLGFAAFTRFDEAGLPFDPRGRRVLGDLWRAEPDDRRRNALSLIGDARLPLRAVLHFAEANAADRFHAETLAHLPGVRLRPLTGAGHNLIGGDAGLLRDLVRLALPAFELAAHGRPAPDLPAPVPPARDRRAATG